MFQIYKTLFLLLAAEYIPNIRQNHPFAFVGASSQALDASIQPPPDADSSIISTSMSTSTFGESAWTIFDPENPSSPCLKLQGQIQFQVSTLDLNNNNIQGTGMISVPETAVATGHCHSLWDDYQDIRLSWDEYEQINVFGTDETPFNLQHNSYSSYSIYFGFVTSWESEFSDLEISSKEFALNSVTIMIEKDGADSNLNHHPMSYSVSDFLAFSTPKNKTFSCSRVQFKSGDLEMVISDFRIQAFNVNGTDFGQTFQCDGDKPENGGKTTLEHVMHGMGWIFISFFALCLFGVMLVLLVGGFNKRHDIMAIGYKFVGTNGNNQASNC